MPNFHAFTIWIIAPIQLLQRQTHFWLYPENRKFFVNFIFPLESPETIFPTMGNIFHTTNWIDLFLKKHNRGKWNFGSINVWSEKGLKNCSRTDRNEHFGSLSRTCQIRSVDASQYYYPNHVCFPQFQQNSCSYWHWQSFSSLSLQLLKVR